MPEDTHVGPTLAEWEEASPYAKGYLSYFYSAWPGSQIPAACPFAPGSAEHKEWERGERTAVLNAQDSDD